LQIDLTALGNMYRHGLGVTQDQEEALKWHWLAAERMTREQIAEAQKLAREWKLKE